MKYVLGFLGGVIVATSVSVFAQWGQDPAAFNQQMQQWQNGQSIMNDGGISEQRRRAGLPPLNHRNPC